jgi:hypothetical protein
MKVLSIVRASMMMGAVTALAVNITFAAQTSNGTLLANTAASATFKLSLSKDGTTFTGSTDGFIFDHIVPGGAGSKKTIHLQNESDVPMDISLAIPTEPAFNGVAGSGVHIKVVRTDAAASQPAQSDTIFSDYLKGGGVAMASPLAANSVGDYDITVSFDKGAVNGESATVSGFDLVFSGTQP